MFLTRKGPKKSILNTIYEDEDTDEEHESFIQNWEKSCYNENCISGKNTQREQQFADWSEKLPSNGKKEGINIFMNS
jgi:hypothetical protein